MMAMAGPAESALLLLDQSARIARLDPTDLRSFAARAFISRAVYAASPTWLSVAGFAGAADNGGVPAALPVQPVWLPLGTNPMFAADEPLLRGLVTILEPYLGGSAPVLDALSESFALITAHAPPGNHAVVAVLGGGDDEARPEVEYQAALASLRRQREDAGIQSVLVAGNVRAPTGDSLALAELSATLRAPVISLGVYQSWDSGIFAALDLAADLIEGAPVPSLSATFVVSASEPGAFASGTSLHGVLYVESSECWIYCSEVPLEFVVEIP
jgi:hypothetical protein